MNLVILVGRITADVDIKMTTSGKKVCSFTLAVDDGKNADGSRRTQFPECVAWEKAAEFLERYVQKGNRIAVEGKLTKRAYESNGQKRYVSEVVVDRVEFADGANQPKNEYSSAPVQTAPQKAQNQPSQPQYTQQYYQPQPYQPSPEVERAAKYGLDISSDDLPF